VSLAGEYRRRRIAAAAAVVALCAAGCTGTGRSVGSACADGSSRATEHEHVQTDLARARARQREASQLNARALGAIAPFRGATLFSQDDNPEDSATVTGNCEYENAVTALSGGAFTTLAATSWGTFRTYRLARPTRPFVVYAYVAARLRSRGWVTKRVHAWGKPSNAYEAYFRKGARCVWILAGLNVSPLPGRVSYTVATDSGAAAAC
jgi:hypothetical protein